MAGTVITLTDADADQTVSAPDTASVVCFHATWCPHCPPVVQLLPGLAAKYAGKVQVCICDVDQCKQFSQAQHVSGIPTMCFYRASDTATECLVGGRSQREYEDEIDKLLRSSACPNTASPHHGKKPKTP